MTEFVNAFADWMRQLMSLLTGVKFQLMGWPVNLLSLFMAFILLSMVISIFWKGAKG